MALVLVTGGSGFLGGHCILKLLDAGHDVRTTVRSLAREAEVRDTLKSAGATRLDHLTFVAADLDKDDGWDAAARGCDYVLHVASPFPPQTPKDEDDLIRPARDGALRVLRAAKAAGVKRVVLTSSFAAIGYGHPPRSGPFTEADFTNLAEPSLRPYVKSKAIAEQAAWDFVKAEGGPELSVVNPTAILGPVFSADASTSIGLVHRLLEGGMPLAPQLWFGVVDARDCADLHLLAMTHPAAAGERFIASTSDTMSVIQVGRVLRKAFPAQSRRVPRFQAPNWLMRRLAKSNPSVADLLPELGKVRRVTGDKARKLLGWTPREADVAIAATAESLLRLGIV